MAPGAGPLHERTHALTLAYCFAFGYLVSLLTLVPEQILLLASHFFIVSS